MARIAVAIVSLAVGTPLGFVLLAAFCSIPGLAFSVACGHNAPIWIPLFLPAAIGGCWLFISRLLGAHSASDHVSRSVVDFRCSKCSGQISSDAPNCSNCGFTFGGNSKDAQHRAPEDDATVRRH
jgi:hypothetical protein